MAINAYHHTPNSAWRQNTNLDGNFVGLELETHNRKGRDVTDRAIGDSGINYKGVAPICETDGSISHTLGTEIICPPVSLANAIKAGGFVDKLLDILHEAGVTEEPERNYGMHMNINVRNWTAQERYLHMFVLRCLKSIAQDLGKRTGESNTGNNVDGYWNPWNDLVFAHNGFSYTPPSKYNPSWIRRNNAVMEVRYPKAVLTFNHVKTNISFMYSIRAFLNTEAGRWAAFYAAKSGAGARGPLATAIETVKQVYLSWLKNQRNFRNLFNAININPENQRAFTLESVKEYCKNSILFADAAVQKQTVEWSDCVAGIHPVSEDS